MSAKFTWTGLDEEYRDLRSLALDLATDADQLAQVSAMAVSGAIAGRYPIRSGRLANNVIAEAKRVRGTYQAGSVVLSTARHAMVWDLGSHGDRYDRGSNRGRMPRGNVFVPQMQRARRAFLTDVKRMLPKWGLRADGNA